MYITMMAAFIDAFVYRFRGGGFFQTGHDWIVRIVWGLALTLTYLATHTHSIDWVFLASITFTAYASLAFVPHGFCQNMGRWATTQKKWPNFWEPTITDASWAAMPLWVRTAYDFGGMASVAFVRGLFVFLLYAATQYFETKNIPFTGLIRAMAVLSVGQPLGYLVGWYMPITIGDSLTKNSTEWGEFYNGAVWAVAMAQL